MVQQGLFREDLFYRLSTIAIDVPALRERPEDVALLARHFVAILNDRYGWRKTLGARALEILRGHEWPGNVRELQHAIEAAVVVCDGDEILPAHLPLALAATPSPASPPGGVYPEGRLPTLREMEREHIARALRSTGGHREKAARALGISERSLYRKLRAYDLLD